MLREHFIPLIQSMHPDMAGNIAGSITKKLLDLDESEVLHMLESQESLKLKVHVMLHFTKIINLFCCSVLVCGISNEVTSAQNLSNLLYLEVLKAQNNLMCSFLFRMSDLKTIFFFRIASAFQLECILMFSASSCLSDKNMPQVMLIVIFGL